MLHFSFRSVDKHGRHRKFLFLIGRFLTIFFSETNCLAKWAELWWEAPIEGSVCISFLKAEWKVNDIGSDHWASIFSEQSTNIYRITICNERCINRIHLTFSLYTNCQNRPCGKEFNTTAFVNLLICNVNVNIILWRNLNIVSTKLFPQSDLLRYQRV
jgi:hypothetical protein